MALFEAILWNLAIMIRDALDIFPVFMRVMWRPRLAALLMVRFRAEPRGVAYISTRSYRIKYANPVLIRELGYSQRELASVNFLALVHPDDLERTETKAAQMLRTGEVAVGFTNRYRRKDGTYSLLRWRAMPVGDWWVCECEVLKNVS